MDRLSPNTSLNTTQELVSPDGRFSLIMQEDGNLVLYRTADAKPLWATNTVGSGAVAAFMRPDGNLLVIRADGQSVWETSTAYVAAWLQVQNDGNAAVCARVEGRLTYSIETLWTTHTIIVDTDRLKSGETMGPGNSITSPNGRFFLRFQSDGNLVLYRAADKKPLWATGTSDSGAAAVNMRADGNLVLINADGQTVWQTGTAYIDAWLQVQNDGNVVIYARVAGRLTYSIEPLWSTGTAAELLIREKYSQLGGYTSPLGLPVNGDLDAQPQPVIEPNDLGGWSSQFRGGVITLSDPITSVAIAEVQKKMRLVFAGLECRVRQESEDEVFGTVGVVTPSLKAADAHHFPVGTDYLQMGKDGSRVVSTEMELFNDAVPADIVLASILIEHDSGDIDQYKRKIADALAQAAEAGLDSVGVPAEATGASQGFLNDLSLGVVDVLSGWLGADDDPYTPQALHIAGKDVLAAIGIRNGEIRDIPDPFPAKTLTRDDTPGVTLNYNLRPVVVSGTDQGGDRGEYGFYFRIESYTVTSTYL